MRASCPICHRDVLTESGWLVQHREPGSSAFCSGSGIPVRERQSQMCECRHARLVHLVKCQVKDCGCQEFQEVDRR